MEIERRRKMFHGFIVAVVDLALWSILSFAMMVKMIFFLIAWNENSVTLILMQYSIC